MVVVLARAGPNPPSPVPTDWRLSYCQDRTLGPRCIRVWRELFAPRRPFSDGREMDSGIWVYMVGVYVMGRGVAKEMDRRGGDERKVVACTAGTDTGSAVHQANALTMQSVMGWEWTEGIPGQDIRRTLPATAALLAVSKRNCRDFCSNSYFSCCSFCASAGAGTGTGTGTGTGNILT